MQRETIHAWVAEHVRRLLEETGRHNPVADDTPLYGREGVLDSLMLMRLVVEVEEAVFQRTGRRITLTSAHAFSERRSPFASVGEFARFVWETLNGEADG